MLWIDRTTLITSHVRLSGWFSHSLLHQTNNMQQIPVIGPPTDIVTHTPSRLECFPFHLDVIFCGSPPNVEDAARAHQQFCCPISDTSGARVSTVCDLVLQQSDCKFRIVPNSKDDPALVHRNYFDRSLSRLSNECLIDLLMQHPTITVDVDTSNTGFRSLKFPFRCSQSLVDARSTDCISRRRCDWAA
jgi:hypothetical protein